jgi:hypothetical protein
VSQPDPAERAAARSRVRDIYAGWRYAAVGLLGGAVVILGIVGFYQSVPDIRFVDALYDTVRLFILEFEVDGEPSLALDIARYGAGAVVYLAVAFAAIGLLGQQFTLARASRLRGHVVVVGDGPEALPVAINFRSAGLTSKVVVINDVGDDIETDRGSGVIHLPPLADNALRRVVDHAEQVLVIGHTDEQTAELAHRLRGLQIDAQFPSTVMLSDRNLAGHWASFAPEEVVCRPARVAIAALRAAPPYLDDAVVPPPVVVGDGPLAAELARRIVTGWQQPGERLRVYCLTEHEEWVTDAAVGIEERADFVWLPMSANVALAPRMIHRILRQLPDRDPRFTHEGPRVYVAYAENSRTVPIAASLARRVREVEVTAVVDDAATWSGTLGDDNRLHLVSSQALLTDPATIRLSVTEMLAAELVADAGRWPADVAGPLGHVVTGRDGAQIADQTPQVQTAVRSVAAHVQQIFAAADVELDAGYPAEVPTLMLGPDELTAVEAALADILGGSATNEVSGDELGGDHDASLRRRADEARLRRLELATRLPVLAARAGLIPVRRGTAHAPLTDEAVRTLALEVHNDYVRTAATTGNATDSGNADLTWDQLSETDQRSSIAQVVDIPVKLAALGLTWRPATDPQPYEFGDDAVEMLAEMEHRRWVHFQLRNGRAKHTFNVTWEGLTDGVQEYDRGPVRLMSRLLGMLGFEIVDAGSST